MKRVDKRVVEVILTKTVKKVGRAGNVIKVRPGYARNYLVPKGIGFTVAGKKPEVIEEAISKIQKEDLEKIEKAQSLLKQLDGCYCEFLVNAGEGGKLFGSVGKKILQDHIQEEYHIDKEHYEIELDKPIKEVGMFEVKLHFYGEGNVAKIYVIVGSSEEEIDKIRAGGKTAGGDDGEQQDANISSDGVQSDVQDEEQVGDSQE